MTCAESELEVEQSLSQFYRFNRYAGEAAVHFGGCAQRCRQTKLMAIVFTGESDSTSFDQAPQTSDHETRILVERDNPVMLAPGE